MRRQRPAHWLLLCGALLLVAACGNNSVRTTTVTPVIAGDPAMPEDQLLDVAVRLFDPGIEALTEEEVFTAPEIRKAEARYIPTVLTDTLQKSGHWGAVRVMPVETGIADVVVEGRIVESTGERLELEISVGDASGAHWYKRSYSGEASKYAYDGTRTSDPFQDVYNRIANDLAMERAKLGADDAQRLHAISELRFAESFSPQAFGGYLEKDKDGHFGLRRLPADDDPMLVRVRKIRERDHLFVDTLQDYYTGFNRQMAAPYQDWRKETYAEGIEYSKLKTQATGRMIGGVLSILAGAASVYNSRDEGSDSQRAVQRAGGTVAILGGATLIKSALGKRADAKMHAETLRELGGSLGAEIDPQVIELEERSVTLTGTVQDQYGQWREILHGIYESETGSI